MSTRCLVSFAVVHGDSGGQVNIYKHYDGNPRVMIPFLKEFIKWNKDGGETEIDPGSIGANFIYWAKMKAKKGIKDSEEKFGKFINENVPKDVKNITPVGNYAIYSDKINYLMPLAYLYSVNFYLKTPKEFDDMPPIAQNIFTMYKDIVKNEDGAPILKIDKIETIDTIEIKRGEGEKRWKN